MHVVFIGKARGLNAKLTQAFDPDTSFTSLDCDSKEVLYQLFALPTDLLVIDGRKSQLDHAKMLRAAREHCGGKTPIFMLADDESDLRVEDYLHAGADGCMRHPVAPVEFRERVAAVMRRQGYLRADQATRFGDYDFAHATRTVTMGSRAVQLRKTEFRLALYLFRNAGRVISREELTRTAGCRTLQEESRTLDTHLSRIRHALGLNKEHAPHLRSIYARGYFLSLDADTQAQHIRRLLSPVV